MKSKDRVKGYKKGTNDWKVEYNMLLDDGITCGDCGNIERCETLGYTSSRENDRCDFYPNKFHAKQQTPQNN